MDPESAWQAILGQLQMQMPRASFETWVRDTKLLEFKEDVFTVGARNEYARDWLENRLLSTVSRLLAGMLNQSVEMRFVVDKSIGEADEEDAEANCADSESDEAELANAEIQVEGIWESAYEQVVRPEKAITLNAYFLRHLRELGPGLGWMYIGFRQAAYSAGGRTGLKAARFTGKSIAILGGMPERTFWNRAARPETWRRLAGLVSLVDEEPQWDLQKVTRGSGKFPKRLPRKFSVSMTLPLTAADTRSLTRWISDHIEVCDGPAGVLAAACEMPLSELIPLSKGQPADGVPLTVRRIVQDLFAGELPPAELEAFAERLHLHLMPPSDLLVITLFFMEHLLPQLGEGQGWMLSILRDRCWVDLASGVKRNQVLVKGGYAEIASWLGLSRAKTIWEWLRDPVVQIYLRDEQGAERAEAGESNKWNAARGFDVLLDEVPGEIVQMVLSGRDPAAHFSALSEGDFSLGVARFRVSGGAIGSMGVARLAVPGGAIGSIGVARLAVFGGAIGRVFKLLNSLNQLLNSKTKPPASPQKVAEEKTSEKAGEGGAGSVWDLKVLLKLNGVRLKNQRELSQLGVSGSSFVSWLIYGATSAGAKLNDPVGNAIVRLSEAPQNGAGGICERLADLPPAKLKAALERSLTGFPVELSGFEAALGRAPKERKEELLGRLFGTQA